MIIMSFSTKNNQKNECQKKIDQKKVYQYKNDCEQWSLPVPDILPTPGSPQ